METKNLCEYDELDLTLKDGEITSYIDTATGFALNAFHLKLNSKNLSKVYILKEHKDFLYVGTTSQSITKRFRSGLKAVGKNGYHGYKWKDKEKVKLFVWTFEGLSKLDIENIEAHLVFLIRKHTGKWPLRQNEIHFNNDFSQGEVIARELFKATR